MSKSERVGVKALLSEQAGMTMRLSLLGLAVMLVLAACGEQVSDAPAAGQEETLADFLGLPYSPLSGPPDDPEAVREQFTRIQESIQQCMADQGFEYQPEIPPHSAFSAGLSEEERVRTYGFGITTWYGRDDESHELDEWVYPNQEMVEALSDSDQQAWFEAREGCFCRVHGWSAEIEEMWNLELADALDATWEQIQADPRLVEADREWAACMTEAGYEFADRDAMDEFIWANHEAGGSFDYRLQQIVGEPFQGWTQEEIDAFFEEATEEEIDAYFAETQVLDQAGQAALEALQQEEIDLALADFGCRGDYFEIGEAVSREYETEFIAEHREVLEKIRDVRLGNS